MFRIIEGDALAVLRKLPDGDFDACLTDPPYGLGFMGKAWDRGVPPSEVWAEVLRVLKPGAHLLAFGGTRTFHRLTCAIEDAGFEIRDCLMWLYGSGFPKSLDIGKALDKQAGAVREVLGTRPRPDGSFRNPELGGDTGTALQGSADGTLNTNGAMAQLTAPATDAAKTWDGYGTALKPAWEPIILAMKPLEGTFADNALQHGVSGLHVAGGRIAGDPEYRGTARKNDHLLAGPNSYMSAGSKTLKPGFVPDAVGRWPANLLLDEDAAAQLGDASRYFYIAKADSAERLIGGENTHPTVKPVNLTAYLAKLLLPPKRDTPRKILVPFSGSGSELMGALRAEWEDATGIELSPEYAAISRRRITDDAPLWNTEATA